MKHGTLIFFLFVASRACGQYTNDHYYTKANIAKQGISSCSVYEMKIRENGLPDSSLYEELFFDEWGNLIEQMGNAYREQNLYTYDEEGRLVLTQNNSLDDPKQSETVTYYYNNNRLDSVVTRNISGRVTIRVHNTYQDSLLVKDLSIYPGYKSFVTHYSYDERNRLVEEWIPDIGRKITYGYDRANNLIEYTHSENDRVVKDIFRVKNNLRMDQAIYANDNLDYSYQMVYDSRELITQVLSCTGYPGTDCHIITKYHYKFRR